MSKALIKYNLPLPPYSNYISEYINIIELDSYQSDSTIIFALKIPLVEQESYKLYRPFPIPVLDNRTGLFHILPTNQKYMAKDYDSLLYIPFANLNDCKNLQGTKKLCSNILSYPIDSDSICEAQLFKHQFQLPKTCQPTLFIAKNYNINQLKLNLSLISVTDPLPLLIQCGVKSESLKVSSLLKLQPECHACIGNTSIRAKSIIENTKEINYKNFPVLIPYDCCKQLYEKINLPEIKPLKLNKTNIVQLHIASDQLSQHSEEIDKILNPSPISQHMHLFTIVSIILIIFLILWYIFNR